MMRVLFVVPYTPNLIRIRSFSLIRSLAGRGHEITVATLTVNEKEKADVKALEAFCARVISRPLPRWRSLWNTLWALPTDKPLQSAYCWQPALVRDIGELLAGDGEEAPFDLVHVEHLRGAWYGLRIADLTGIPIIWDSVDCISFLFRQAAEQSRSLFGRWVTRFELGRTEQYERWLQRQFNQVLVTSPADRQALIALQDDRQFQAPIVVIPNGVDLSYFGPPQDVERERATLVFSGKMSYHANVTMVLHLVREILPHVWAQRPEVKLTVVGKDPPREIQALASNPNVTVTGTVPDIRPFLQRATMAVVPLIYGAGSQFKILEAMACATPVVTTPRGAAPLAAEPGRALLVAEGASDFARAIVELLDDPAKRAAVGAAGFQYVNSHHDWDKIAGRLEEAYRSAIRAAAS